MRPLWLLAMGLAFPAIACSSGSDPHSTFQQRLEAGATCQELFAIRNALDPKSPSIWRMNGQLREVGCYSASSIRSAAGTSTEAGNTAGANAVGADPSTAPATFTVREYRVYRSIIDTPMSVPRDESIEAAASRYNMPVTEVKAAADKVQKVLFANKWYGSAEAEIQHASDWKGESR